MRTSLDKAERALFTVFIIFTMFGAFTFGVLVASWIGVNLALGGVATLALFIGAIIWVALARQKEEQSG